MDDATSGGQERRDTAAGGRARPDTSGSAQCPACGSTRVIPVLYGPASSELLAAFAAGRAAIGGARALESSPRWECRDCDHRWSHETVPGVGG